MLRGQPSGDSVYLQYWFDHVLQASTGHAPCMVVASSDRNGLVLCQDVYHSEPCLGFYTSRSPSNIIAASLSKRFNGGEGVAHVERSTSFSRYTRPYIRPKFDLFSLQAGSNFASETHFHTEPHVLKGFFSRYVRIYC